MNIDKALGILIVGASVVGSHLAAAPLEETYVAEEAKWLAHIDVEALKESVVGKYAIDHLKTEIARNNKSKISVDVDMVLDEIKSITAYGQDFENQEQKDAVIVMKTGDKLPAILDGFLVHESLMGDGDAEFEIVDDKPYTTYLFGDELYVSNPETGLILASMRFEQIEKAYAVYKGEANNATKADSGIVLNKERGFFLIATATGLADLKNMPAQARILQKTTGGQVSLGESEGKVRANIVLATSGSDVSQQIYRIVQGMLALVSFANVENQGLSEIVSGINVEQFEKAVSVDLRYPVADLMKLIGDLMKDHGHGHHQGGGDETSSMGFEKPSIESRVASELLVAFRS